MVSLERSKDLTFSEGSQRRRKARHLTDCRILQNKCSRHPITGRRPVCYRLVISKDIARQLGLGAGDLIHEKVVDGDKILLTPIKPDEEGD